jgi:tetratricopeptide (TPR) repeat protein
MIAVFALVPVSAHAQAKLPPRPKLPDYADTNDAQAYYDYGNLQTTSWNDTQAAYYWAYRLNPNNPVVLLAYSGALFYRHTNDWIDSYYEGADFIMKSKDVHQMDSLEALAYLRDPFAHFFNSICHPPDWVQDVRDPALSGQVYYNATCYAMAGEKFAQAIRQNPKQLALRVLHARTLFFTSKYDSAISELQLVVDSLRAHDKKKIVHSYDTKEMFEYMIGTCFQRLGNQAAAREAYGRALGENLSFYQAHRALGKLAAASGDKEGATVELGLAVQLEPNDGILRLDYGRALERFQKFPEAEAQFRKAIELEPYYYESYYELGFALDMQGRGAEAVDAYRQMIARVPRNRPDFAKQGSDRIDALLPTLNAQDAGAAKPAIKPPAR